MPPTDAPRIVHVLHSLQRGGMERTLGSLLERFDRRVGRHAVVTLRDAGPLAASLPSNTPCVAIGARGRARTAAWKLAWALRNLRPAVIHARNSGCWLDALIARNATPGARLVIGFHGLESDGPFDVRQRATLKLARWIGASFSAVSETARDKLRDEAAIPDRDICVLGTGVATHRFENLNRAAARAALEVDPKTIAVGVVAALTPVKGHHHLIDAIATISRTTPVSLYVAGAGPLESDLRSRVDRLGASRHVRFLSHVEDVSRLLAALDVFVCSSLSEGMSNAVLEAMAAGVAIVTTAVGDHPRILRDGISALVVRPGSSSALARAIGALAGSTDLRRRLGQAARQRAADFDLEILRRRYESFYAALTPSRRCAPMHHRLGHRREVSALDRRRAAALAGGQDGVLWSP